MDKKFEGYYTLQFMEQGGGTVEVCYDDRSHTLSSEAGAWFWPAFPGPQIRFHAADGQQMWCHRYAAFQGTRVSRWVAEGLWPSCPQMMPSGNYSIRFDNLLNLLRGTTPDPWRSARAANLLEALLLELAEARAGEIPVKEDPRAWLRDVFQALSGTTSPNCKQIACQMGMAPSTLRRRFREAAGIPLHEYVLQQRVARARSLLGDTDLPIKSIAEQLGYQDVYFFTRQFRLRTGATPAVYRRSRQS